MQDSIRLRTTPDLATAGEPTELPAPSGGRIRRAVVLITRSLFTRLLLLAIIFSAVPVILYTQFRDAYDENQKLLVQSVREQGLLIARALRPLLSSGEGSNKMPSPTDLSEALSRLSGGQITLRVLLQPASSAGSEEFYYVAAAPAVTPADLAVEREELVRLGVLEKLAPSCAGGIETALRYPTQDGSEQVVTSITPLTSPAGCWVVVTSHPTSVFFERGIDKPYWHRPEVRTAAAIYGLMALSALALFLGVLGGLRRFGRMAERIRDTGSALPAFAVQNRIPELSGVAREFDRMVESLQNSARTMRRSAEDNAHAFKTPIAIMRQSLEPLERSIRWDDGRGRRALQMMGQALDRLDGLVSFARRLDETEAELVVPPRQRVDLSSSLDRLLTGYAEFINGRAIVIDRALESNVYVTAGEELLETVVENVMDNALGFTPDGGVVKVALSRNGKDVRLCVEDTGPGVPDADLNRIFDRYFSSRERAPCRPNGEDDDHMGIGLWIVRRNVEAIGGKVVAENRESNGLRITVTLPTAA